MAKRGMNLAAIKGAIASPKTPINLKKGLIKKYGAQLGISGSSLPYGTAPSKAPRYSKPPRPRKPYDGNKGMIDLSKRRKKKNPIYDIKKTRKKSLIYVEQFPEKVDHSKGSIPTGEIAVYIKRSSYIKPYKMTITKYRSFGGAVYGPFETSSKAKNFIDKGLFPELISKGKKPHKLYSTYFGKIDDQITAHIKGKKNPLAKWETPAMHKKVKRCVKHVSKAKGISPYGICKASVGGFTKHNPKYIEPERSVYYGSAVVDEVLSLIDKGKSIGYIKRYLKNKKTFDIKSINHIVLVATRLWRKKIINKKNPFLETSAAIAAGITAGEVGRHFVQKRMKKNPGAAWHKKEADELEKLYNKTGNSYAAGAFFAHDRSIKESEKLGLKNNPWRRTSHGFASKGEARSIGQKLANSSKVQVRAEKCPNTGKWHLYVKKSLMKNPPKGMTKIYENVTAIEATKGSNSLWPGEKFRHTFSTRKGKAAIYGKPDGTLVIKGPKKLWKNFNYPKGSV